MAVEAVVRQFWTELLGCSPESAPDFFESGGNSLLAARLANRVGRELARPVDLSLVFENREFADYVAAVAGLAQTGPVDRPSVHPANTGGEWSTRMSFNQRKRLTNIQRRIRSGGGQRAKNAVLVLDLTGRVDLARLERAFGDLVRRQPALRTSFDISGPEPRWRCADDIAPPPVTVRDLRATRNEQSPEDLFQQLIATPIPVDAAPLLRAELLRLDDDRSRLLIAFEHLICDGVSLDIVRRQLIEAYVGLPEGAAPSPPRHPQDLLADRDEELELDPAGLVRQWREALAGLDHPVEFDLSRDRVDAALPQPTDHREAELAGTGTLLLERCRDQGVSDTAVTLAAVYLTLRLTTGQQDIPLVLASARRDTAEADELVDWFADLVVVRCRVPGDPLDLPIGDVVKRIQQEMWAANRRAVSFNLLLDQVCGVPLDGKADFPWVFVSYLHRSPVDAREASVRIEPVRPPASAAFFHGPSIEVEADGSGLHLHLTTVTGRYPDQQPRRFLTGLRDVLQAIAAESWQRSVREIGGVLLEPADPGR